MAYYTIATLDKIDFAPATEAAEIIQNVRTIISTRRGDVPLDRSFGVPWDFVDMPMPLAQATMQAEIIEAIEEYEPRAKVKSITFKENEEDAMNGVLTPRVVISLTDSQQEEELEI